jgi:hypothetical protein
MKANFCAQCGSPLDEKTRLCPRCNAAEINKINMQSPAPMNNKKKNGAIIAIVIIAVVAVLIAAATVVLVFTGVLSPDKLSKNSAVRESYATYVRDNYADEMGFYSAEEAEKNKEGIYSVYLGELEENKGENMLVAYAKKSNGKLEHRLDAFSAEEGKEKTKVNKTDSLVLIKDDLSEEEFPSCTERALYTAEKDGKTYIVYEALSYFEGSSYEAHFYTLTNGKLKEEGNVFVPGISSTGEEIVYSTCLPEGMEFDNSDFSFKDLEDGDYIKQSFSGKGKSILYYTEGDEDSNYKYSTYYESVNDAVSGVFASFSIDKKDYLIYDMEGGNRYFRLSLPNKKQMIYNDVRYYENEGDSQKAHYEFKDYTDAQDFMKYAKDGENAKEKTTVARAEGVLDAEDKDFRNFEKMLSEVFIWTYQDVDHGEKEVYNFSKASQYDIISQFFSPPSMYAYLNKLEYSDIDDGDPKRLFPFDGYGTKLSAKKADWIMKNVFNIKPKHKAEKLKSEYYGDESDTYLYYYQGDYLYVFPFEGGFEGSNTYTITDYRQLENGEYEITVSYDYYNDFREEDRPESKFEQYDYIYTFTAALKNSNIYGRYWSLKKYVCERPNSDDLSLCIYDAYSKVVQKERDKGTPDGEVYEYGPYYTLYDMNSDEIPELILRKGQFEAEYEFEFYTYDNGLVKLGSCSGWHSGLYAPKDGNGILRANGYGMDAGDTGEDLYRYTIKNNKLKEECIYTEKRITGDEEEEDNEYISNYIEEYDLQDDYMMTPMQDILS